MKPSRGRITTSRPRRIQFQQETAAPSSVDGSITSTWATFACATTIGWRTSGGRVEYLADEPRPDDSAVIRIRWRSDINVTPALRILYVDGTGASRIYDINTVIDVGNQHQYWDIYVREKSV